MAISLWFLFKNSSMKPIESFKKTILAAELAEDLILADPKEDWQERRLILTLIDEDDNRYEKLISPLSSSIQEKIGENN